MKSRALNRTPEQIEYWNTILKVKQKSLKYNTVIQTKKTSRKEYMENCLFWINEFFEGRSCAERASKAAVHLKHYCDEIIKLTN